MLFSIPIETHLKVSLLTRIIAKIIDLLLFMLLAIVLPLPLGPLLGFLYSLFADGFCFANFRGQSIGKKIMRLKVIHRLQKRPANFKESALRNLP
ncbi:MAG: RDD family protein [Deltaproteobacteria bacterium]|nr:RDD family protein [Deltaproteobacteria bacterium]